MQIYVSHVDGCAGENGKMRRNIPLQQGIVGAPTLIKAFVRIEKNEHLPISLLVSLYLGRFRPTGFVGNMSDVHVDHAVLVVRGIERERLFMHR